MGRSVKGYLSILLFVFLLLLGCGHKTPPVPPRSYMPRPVEIKEIKERPDGVYLTFLLPRKLVRRGKIETGVFYKVERCIGERCVLVAEDRGDPGSLVTVVDRGAREGMFYQYVVRPKVLAWGIPMEASVKVGPWPSPPLQVSAKGFQDKVMLYWKGKGTFSLYRRVGKGKYSIMPLAVVRGNVFKDGDVENGVTYFYVMRGVRQKGILAVEGYPSTEVSATPMDTVPPPVPKGLSLYYRKGAVYIAWEPVYAKDLAGYYLYRRKAGGEWKRVVKECIMQPTYVDGTVKHGQRYEYRVASVDLVGNVSAPSKAVAIQVPSGVK